MKALTKASRDSIALSVIQHSWILIPGACVSILTLLKYQPIPVAETTGKKIFCLPISHELNSDQILLFVTLLSYLYYYEHSYIYYWKFSIWYDFVKVDVDQSQEYYHPARMWFCDLVV